MILHASIQLFSRTAPRKQEFSTARKAGATLLGGSARVDFIRNVGEPFEGVREPPFPPCVYTQPPDPSFSLFPSFSNKISTYLFLSLSLFLHSQQIHQPCSNDDCQRSDRYINISRTKSGSSSRAFIRIRRLLYITYYFAFEIYLFCRDTRFHA